MAKSMIPEGKIRVMLTLDAESVREMKRVAKELGMPRTIVSTVCEESIKQSVELWKKVQRQGKFTISDLFTQLAQMTIEEETNVKQTPKAKKMAK